MAEHSYETTLLDINAVVPDPTNPNHGDVGAIATAIGVDGFHGLIVCQMQGKKEPPMIVAGEHRWRALRAVQEDGYTFPDGRHVTYDELLAEPGILLPPRGKIPGQVLTLSELQARRKLLADNTASRLATPDIQLEVELMQALAEQDALLGSLRDGDDLDGLLRDLAGGFQPNYTPTVATRTVTDADVERAQRNADGRFDRTDPDSNLRQVACPGCGHEFDVVV